MHDFFIITNPSTKLEPCDRPLRLVFTHFMFTGRIHSYTRIFGVYDEDEDDVDGGVDSDNFCLFKSQALEMCGICRLPPASTFCVMPESSLK